MYIDQYLSLYFLMIDTLKMQKSQTPLFTIRVVPQMVLKKEWWLIYSFRRVSLQDRVKNHSKRSKLQSKIVEDHSKKELSYGFSLFCIQRVNCAGFGFVVQIGIWNLTYLYSIWTLELCERWPFCKKTSLDLVYHDHAWLH